MKIIKKNQLTVLVLSIMLVTAGYLNYNSTIQTSTEVAQIGDATLVSSNISNTIENNTIDNAIVNNTTIVENNIVNEEKIEENKIENSDYFVSSKLDRQTMYSQMLESYQKIIESTNTNDKQKEAAQEEINKINKTKNSIMISENLIKTKGFEDNIILVNDDNINIVIKKEELKKEDIAQIQSIIAREMNADIDNIHIMNLDEKS